jgi:protein SCO1/2
VRRARLTLLAVAATATLAGCGGSSTVVLHLDASTAPNGFAASAVMTPPRTAPAFTLRNSLGKTDTLSRFRGRAVILTFIYSHCPDVCPLIVAKLHAALAALGREAGRVQMVGVSVDPRGDTRSEVNSFLARHDVTGRFEYLIGSRSELAPVWHAYHVAVVPHTGTTVVGHAAVLYGIGASGRELTVYSASNFTPQMIVHDVPLLARN